MAAVAIVLNESRHRAVELAHQAVDWLLAHDHQVRVPDEEAETAGLGKHGCPSDELGPGADLALSLGGDGTILRALGLVAPHQVPVLGVNLGRLGYLAHVEPDALVDSLERFAAGDYSVEERMLLCVKVEPGPGGGGDDGGGRTLLALNEAVVEKPSAGQVVHVAVSVDGRFWITYAADGIIVATPTGSTAYSFSAHGPIVAPSVCALLLTPVSPHMAFDRSLVFDSDQALRLEVLDRPARLIVDGRELGPLAAGAAVTCTAAPEVARFVAFGTRDFYGVLKAKFGLHDR